MPKRFLVLAVCAGLTGGLALAPFAMAQEIEATTAVSPEVIATLGETLMIGPVIEILRDEGVDYGATLETQMFPGQGGASWGAAVARIYDAGLMRGLFDASLAQKLAGDQSTINAAEAFFGSALGQRILALETEARRALMDDAAEDAAKLRFAEMEAAGEPRLEAIRRFAEVNELSEMNVVGALNSNLAFYRGMADTGAFGGSMTEEDMLSEVWGQEDQVREETESWLFPYLTLAYSALSDEELAEYIAYSQTPEGRRLNIAMFAAFDTVFSAISLELGRAAGRQLQGQDI